MANVVFSQAGIFHLQQLETQFRKRFGKRFKLSEEEGRMELIRESSDSADHIIQKYFRTFYHELEPQLVQELISRGIVKTPKGFKMPNSIRTVQ